MVPSYKLKDWLRARAPGFFLDWQRRVRELPKVVALRREHLGDSALNGWASGISRLIKPRATVTYFPVRPAPAFLEFKLCAILGYAVSDHLVRSTRLLHGREFCDVRTNPIATNSLSDTALRINCGRVDIRKSTVASLFESVFGYSLGIDPLSFVGSAVRKSDRNYTHDGVIVDCPLSSEQFESDSGMVYQRLVDNSQPDGTVLDIRVPVIGNSIPLLQLKWRRESERFSNNNTLVRVAETDACFSPEEQEILIRFAGQMSLQFCEMDVLRDRSSGQIYVVDCNSTPAFGPPPGMDREAQSGYLKKVGSAYRDLLKDGKG